jgi:hypothetical protein
MECSFKFQTLAFRKREKWNLFHVQCFSLRQRCGHKGLCRIQILRSKSFHTFQYYHYTEGNLRNGRRNRLRTMCEVWYLGKYQLYTSIPFFTNGMWGKKVSNSSFTDFIQNSRSGAINIELQSDGSVKLVSRTSIDF